MYYNVFFFNNKKKSLIKLMLMSILEGFTIATDAEAKKN